MDSKSLHTASSYINNLLLSRGLLRNGTPIDFAEPTKAEGGVDATMAKVMNLVHDMILRRDREANTLSNLSHNLQTVRTTSAQQTQTIARLESGNAELDRQLALSNAQEKTARATLRSAETRTRALREEMARLKGTVAQIRAQCANDIRRRDGEIKRLKRHLEGRRGREGNGGQVGVVVITPGPTRTQQHPNGAADACVDVASPEYSLKQETTEFLTQLSQGLSDENDALIGLVRNTLATLRSLQGLPLGDMGCANVSLGQGEPADVVMTAPPSYEELAVDTDGVLEHLRGLLTNPSFVPLEEVEIREDEIIRLREGWEKMATRWKEAVAMMDGWRRRMVDTGDTVNLDDLTKGMSLAVEMPAASGGQEDLRNEEGEGQDLSDLSDGYQQAVLESPNPPLSVDDREMDEMAADISSTSNVLKATSANARPRLSVRKESFASIREGNGTFDDKGKDSTFLKFPSVKPLSSPNKRRSPTSSPVSSSPRAVKEKLDNAQAEADEARQRTEQEGRKNSAAKAVNRRLKGSRRRSTLSPKELEDLMGAL